MASDTRAVSVNGRLAYAVLVVAGVAVGLSLRLWMLFHRPLTSDEAVVGLMARQIRHGQMFTFFWGQPYGGAEPYLVAIWTPIAGHGPVALNEVPTILAALAAVLTWRAARRLLPPDQRALAAAAGLATWIWPDMLIYNSTRELGFRGVTLAAGVGLLLLTLRACDDRSAGNLAGLGLVAGIGWWSSPEILYFLIPAAVLIILHWAVWRAIGVTRLALLAGTAVLGAGPWLATNIQTGFSSLRASSSPEYIRATYFGRLSTFFDKTLPMVLSLRAPRSGAWLWGTVGRGLYAVAILAIIGSCAVALTLGRRGDPTGGIRAVAGTTLIFPFVYAVFPATSYWPEGQYAVYLVPLLALMVTGAAAARMPSVPAKRALGAVAAGLVGVAVISLGSFNEAWLGSHPGRFFTDWGGANAVAERSGTLIELQGVHYAYAEYWVAYDLDYLSQGRLTVTDPYSDRWVAGYYRVARSPDPAWIFFDPTQLHQAASAFSSSAPGPFGYSEARFLTKLRGLGVTWTLSHAGVLDVVRPDRPLTPSEVGIPGPYYR